MPTVIYDAYQTISTEWADNDLNFVETGTSRYGFPSHIWKLADGAAWNSWGQIPWPYSTRRPASREEQYAVYGTRDDVTGVGGTSCSVAWYVPGEGGYSRHSAFIFKVPLGRMEVTSATLYVYPDADSRRRIFGVAMDNFVTQYFGSGGYPTTYRSEFHERTWLPQRRYRSESREEELPHTVAQVFRNVGEPEPNLAPVINEIMSRPGWKAGNLICLLVEAWFEREPVAHLLPIQPSLPPELGNGFTERQWPLPPELESMTGIGVTMSAVGESTWPKLELTY